MTTKEYGEKLLEKSDGKLILESEYITMHKQVTFRCRDCGTVRTRTADNAIHRPWCTVCNEKRGFHKKQKISELVHQFAKKNKISDYEILSYQKREDDADTKLKVVVTHKPCGFTKKMNPYELPKYTCPQCKREAWEAEQLAKFKEEVEKLSNGEYEVVGDRYINNATKMEMYHKECGKYFPMSRNHFVSSVHRCPFCSSSKGEQTVAKVLDDMGIKYIHGEKHPECINPKSGKALEMDFQLLDGEDKVFALIEYDGKQHFSSEEQFGASNKEENWEKIVYRDSIRDGFAKERGIPLLRIPYMVCNEEPIKSMIIDFLDSHRMWIFEEND